MSDQDLQEFTNLVSVAIQRLKAPMEPIMCEKPLWFHVARLFSIGSNRAQALCVMLGHDPDHMIPAYDLSNHEQCPVCGAEIQDSYEQFLEHSNRQSERDAAAGVRS